MSPQSIVLDEHWKDFIYDCNYSNYDQDSQAVPFPVGI